MSDAQRLTILEMEYQIVAARLDVIDREVAAIKATTDRIDQRTAGTERAVQALLRHFNLGDQA